MSLVDPEDDGAPGVTGPAAVCPRSTSSAGAAPGRRCATGWPRRASSWPRGWWWSCGARSTSTGPRARSASSSPRSTSPRCWGAWPRSEPSCCARSRPRGCSRRNACAAAARRRAARRAGRQPRHRGLSGLPRPAHGLGVRLPHLACAGHRAGSRCACLHRPGPHGAQPERLRRHRHGARRGSAGGPRRLRDRGRGAGRRRARPSRSSPASGTPATRRVADIVAARAVHHADRVRAADRAGDPAVVGGARGGAGRAAGPPRPGLPERRPGPRPPGPRAASRRRRGTSSACTGSAWARKASSLGRAAPGPAGVQRGAAAAPTPPGSDR